MKRNHIILLFLFISGITYRGGAQNYLGAHYSSYDAILSTNSNPAMLAASDMKWQVGLFGFDMNLDNNYFAIDSGLIGFAKDFDKETSFTQMLDGNSKYLYLGSQVQGPTGYFRVKKNAFIIGLRAEAYSSMNDWDEDMVYSLYNNFKDILNWLPSFSDARASGAVTAYHELYAGYGRTIHFKNEKHKLHLGGTFGILTTVFNAEFIATNIDFNKIYTSLTDSAINVGNTQFDFFLTDQVDDGYTYKFGFNGFRMDIGGIYEFQKQNTSDHYLVAGFSANNLGFTQYTLGKNSRSFIGNGKDVPASSLVDADGETNELDQVLDSLGTRTIPTGKQKLPLPTTISAFCDLRIVRMFYINANFQFNLLSKNNGDPKANQPTDLTITPRFEVKAFSAFVPIGWNKYNGFYMGAGMRVGQFTIGSRNVLSAFVGKHFTGCDFYMNVSFGKRTQTKAKKGKSDGTIEEAPAVLEEAPTGS